MSASVIIIGSGIVGAACAAACARAGMAVTIVARGFCDGATAAGMGHIVVMDDSPAQFALTKSGADIWRQFVPDMPPAVEYDPCGTLWLAADEEQLAIAQKKCAYYNENGVAAEMVDAGRLRQIEPSLTPTLVGALRIPGDSVLYPPAATQYLLEDAQNNGMRLVTENVVTVTANSVQLANGTTLHADRIVVAAGCGSSQFGIGTAVRPRKGHLIITERYPGFVNHQLVELGYLTSAHTANAESVAFNVQPRMGGQVLIGSSRQFDVESPAIESHLIKKMYDYAQTFVPGIGKLQVLRCWTGFRPATNDHLPLIGQAESGVWYATGHEGLGITTAPPTAKLLVELMTGQEPHLPAHKFAPDRFTHNPTGHSHV